MYRREGSKHGDAMEERSRAAGVKKDRTRQRVGANAGSGVASGRRCVGAAGDSTVHITGGRGVA